MTDIRSIIGKELASRPALSFARFMELALYCPKIGYYERTDESPGRQGDFFTSVSVGPLFGKLLAHQFISWLAALPGGRVQLLESGAHDGRLALDILQHLQSHHPGVLELLEYWILEPSPRRRSVQEKSLAGFAGRVRWYETWDALPDSGVRGIIFSNELLDAMPVHRLGWDAATRQWFEWGVALEGEKFVWKKLAALDNHVSPPALPEELLNVLPDGFTTEVCPAAVAWWQRAAQSLRAGKLLTFDYGLTAEQFFSPERKNGTLRAYYQHHANTELLDRPGEQDLTASVNFTAIQAAGESAGLATEVFQTQAEFLARIVVGLAGDEGFKEWFAPLVRQFQTLTHPEHLGQSFRVLVQAK